MDILNKSVAVLLLFSLLGASAQDNVFLERDYWTTHPSKAQIEKDIASGNDISALNEYAFDAVTLALLEKVDNETIKYLLGKEGNGVNKLTHDARTYIFWAAYKDNLAMMEYLLQQGAKTDIVDSHGYSLLNFAAVTGQTNTRLYDFILDHGANIQSEINRNGANALLLVAPFIQDFAGIDYFVGKGLSLRDTDEHGNGIFSYAAKGGNLPILKKLVNQGVPYAGLNKTGGNAMLMASQGTRGNPNTLETYKYLESLGIDANITDQSGNNPLHNIAYSVAEPSIYNYFLEQGISVDQKDEDGRTPFMNAAQYNDLDVIKLLAESAQNIDAQDKEGRTALALAVHRNQPEVVAFLLEKGVKTNLKDKNGNTLAYYLMKTYNAKRPEAFEAKLALLEDKAVSLNTPQQNMNSLYHLACKSDNLPLLKRLEPYNIPVNAKNANGNTALQLAAMSAKDDSILKYLIQKGADKTVMTDFEESVFDLASENELLKANGIVLDFLK
ncbi:MAG: ankyrin repeat domain-containing protein [Bacteroidota bacterium]